MRKIRSGAARSRCFWILLVLLSPQAARGHVDLDSPLSGESLAGGFAFPIEWHVAIGHNTNDWDLWYSTSGADGPWIDIASDLPLGDLTEGVPHFFDWQVPNADFAQAWVRVRQDNAGEDYYSVSPASFTIAAAAMGDFTGNGVVDGNDLSIWQGGFGNGAFFSQGDDDADGDVDGNDFLRWQRNYGFGTAVAVQAVPEPTSLLLFLLVLGVASALIRRH